MSEYFSYFCIFLAGNHSQARGILDLTYFPTKARVLHETCRCNDKHYLYFLTFESKFITKTNFLRLLCPPLTFGSLSDALLPGSNWNFFIQTLFVGFCLRFILICWRFSGTVDSISVVGDVVSSAAVDHVIVVTRHTLWLLQLFPRRRTVLLRNSWKWIFIRTE